MFCYVARLIQRLVLNFFNICIFQLVSPSLKMRLLGYPLLLTFSSSLLILCASEADFPAPRLEVDLDAPPSERWVPVLDELVRLRGSWQSTGKAVFDYLATYGTTEQWHSWNSTLTKVGLYVLGEETVAESYSLVKYANEKFEANVTLGAVCFFQMFYEIAMECTGTLAHSTNGGIVHGRNMDMGLPVKNLTAQLTWKKGGKSVLTTTQYIGYFGVHTGMRLGGWSVQANERVVLLPGPIIGYEKSILLATVASFALGATPVGTYLRNALLSAATFEEALPILESTHLASPMYIIVGGAKEDEGAVITRGRKGVATTDNFNLPIPNADKSKAVWKFADADGSEYNDKRFHIQTNWDWWHTETADECRAGMAKLDPKWESLCEKVLNIVFGGKNLCNHLCQEFSDGRREAGEASLNAAFGNSPSVDYEALFGVMSKAPVLNGITRFTSIMSAATGYYNTTVRGGVPPSEDDRKSSDELKQKGADFLDALLKWGQIL